MIRASLYSLPDKSLKIIEDHLRQDEKQPARDERQDDRVDRKFYFSHVLPLQCVIVDALPARPTPIVPLGLRMMGMSRGV